MTFGKHKRLLNCPKCETNLKSLLYYSETGKSIKVDSVAYCPKCDCLFEVKIKKLKAEVLE